MTDKVKTKAAAGGISMKKGTPKQLGSQKAAPQGGAARGLPGPSVQVPEKTGPVTQSVNLLIPGVPGERQLSFRETHPEELPEGVVTKAVATGLSINGRHFAAGELIAGDPAILGSISGLK